MLGCNGHLNNAKEASAIHMGKAHKHRYFFSKISDQQSDLFLKCIHFRIFLCKVSMSLKLE